MSFSAKDLTVIVPSADRGEMISRAVDSLLEQNTPPKEVIVVDNGVMPIEKEFPEMVRVVRTKPRIGPGKSRNVGASLAETKLIAFLDDDDVWEQAYIEHSLSCFNDHGPDVVVGQLKRRSATGNLSTYKTFPDLPEQQRQIYFRNPGFGGQNIMMKREVFLAIGGFDESLPASVDRDLAATLLANGYSIAVQPLSVAVLFDHVGPRVRQSQVRGNRMFIQKHWRRMRLKELLLAVLTYLRRLVRYAIVRRVS